MMAYAADFVEDRALGYRHTGNAHIADLDRLVGQPRVLARAKGDWQVYRSARQMPWKHVPGVNWRAWHCVRWYTVEAPVGGITSPGGHRPGFTPAAASSSSTP